MISTELAKAMARIPEHQRSIFLPQVEQFNMEAVPVRFGVMGRVRIPQATGWCWAASIDEFRMITIVRIALSEDFPFYEQPGIEYSCIAALSTASARIMNAIWAHDLRAEKHARNSRTTGGAGSTGGAIGTDGAGNAGKHAYATFSSPPGAEAERLFPASAPLLEAEEERVMAFAMKPRLYESPLAAGTTHVGAAVHLFPGYFEMLERQCPGELGWLQEAIESHIDASDSLELKSVLRSITPRQANQPGARLHYEAKTLEAVSALARHLSSARQEVAPPSSTIGDRAKELIASSLDRPPSLDELASACYTSRTTLCTEFKRAYGMSVGAYQTKVRIARAKELLETTDEPSASIAQQVGYRHASTFTTAFKHASGLTPQAWRSSARRRT